MYVQLRTCAPTPVTPASPLKLISSTLPSPWHCSLPTLLILHFLQSEIQFLEVYYAFIVCHVASALASPTTTSVHDTLLLVLDCL